MSYTRSVVKDASEPNPSGLIILYELITGVFEILFGLAILIYGDELLELYHNVIFSNFFVFEHTSLSDLAQSLIPYLFDHFIFISIFFLSFGVVKIICGVGIFYKKQWANFLLATALVGLLPFDIVSLIQNYAIFKVVYLIINIAILFYLFRSQSWGKSRFLFTKWPI